MKPHVVYISFPRHSHQKLPILLTNKYQSLEDAKEALGSVGDVRQLFIDFQKYLYEEKVAI